MQDDLQIRCKKPQNTTEQGILLPCPTQSIVIDGLNIRYCCLSKGEGREVLLLVHGLGASLDYWYHNLAYWSQHYQVIALDLPGFGHSDPPKNRYDVDYFTDFIDHFLAALQISQVNVVAHSLGGILMLQYAIKYLPKVKKLILLDNVGFSTELSWHFRILTIPGIRTLLMNFSRPQYAIGLRSHVYNRASITEEFIDCLYEMAKQPKSKEVLLRILADNASVFGIKLSSIQFVQKNLSKLKELPMLIFWGKQDPILHFTPHTEAARKLLPHVPLIALDDCGHIPQIEQYAMINEEILKFLLN